MGDTAEVAIMTDSIYQRLSEVETLELLDSSTLGVLSVQLVCGGAAPDERFKYVAWFNPAHHLDWYGSTYWRNAQASRVALTASPDASEASSVGYRLPITWGAYSKH